MRAAGEETSGEGEAHLSNALGVETLLLTADGKMVLLRRSSAVATHCGEHNGPSGHPEPAHVSGIDDVGSAEPDKAKGLEADVLAELFSSVLQEAHEETNIPLDAFEPPQLIGETLHHHQGGRQLC